MTGRIEESAEPDLALPLRHRFVSSLPLRSGAKI
jgi:hypothetical protein